MEGVQETKPNRENEVQKGGPRKKWYKKQADQRIKKIQN